MCSSQRFYRDRRDFSWWPVRERLPGKVDETVGLFDQGKCGPNLVARRCTYFMRVILRSVSSTRQ